MLQADNPRGPALRAFDLQLFSDEGEPQKPQDAEGTGDGQGDRLPSDVLSFLQGQMGAEEGGADGAAAGTGENPEQSTQQPSEPEPTGQEPGDELILGKFKSQDELARAYQEAEKKISEYGQQSNMTQKQIDELSQNVGLLMRQMGAQGDRQPQQQPYGQPQYPHQQQPQGQPAYPGQQPDSGFTPQFQDEQGRQLTQEQWQDTFDENPQKAINLLLQSNIQPLMQQYIQPMSQELQQVKARENWNSQIVQAKEKYEDLSDMYPAMQEIFQEKPHLINSPDAVEVVYNLAKARQAPQVKEAPLDPSRIAEDQETLQKLFQDPKVKSQVVKMLTEEARQRQKAPTVMGEQPGGGFAPAAPIEEIKSAKDANKHAAGFLAKFMGGGQ